MNNLQIFQKENLGKIRIITNNNEIWFIAKDIANILGYYDTTAMTKRLDNDEKKSYTDNLSGQRREIIILNESGLYNAIIGSKKPEAKFFKKWITSEVLPTIRKTGGYVQENRAIDFVNNWLPTIDDISKNAIAGVLEQNRKLLIENKEMQPKALFYDTVTQSETWLDFAEVSKIINKKGFGRNKLMKFLRQNDILRFNNTPYQTYVDRGYFKIVESYFVKNNEVCIGIKTVISQKGVDYILKKLGV